MSDPNYSPAVVREIVAGELQSENDSLDAHTGRVDTDLGRVLSFRAAAWSESGESRPYERTRKWREAVRTIETARTTEAIEAGNSSQLAYETGVTEREMDTSYVHSLALVYGLLRNEGQILNFCGGTNNGKTNVALLAIDVKTEMEPETQVFGNIPADSISTSWDYSAVTSIADLEESMLEEPDRSKVILVDDASIDHSAHSSNAHEVAERQGRLARLAAKLSAVLIFVGHRHDGRDIAKHIRSMPDVKHLLCIRETRDDGTVEQYICSVYSEITENGLTDLQATLTDLPEARSSYDPDVIAHNLFSE